MYVRPHIDYHAVLLDTIQFLTLRQTGYKKVLLNLCTIYTTNPFQDYLCAISDRIIHQRVERLRYSLGERILQMKKTIIRFAFLRLFSKNIRNIKNCIKTFRKKFPNMDAKERFKKLNKENLRVNFDISKKLDF
ncbi:hypothetical protein CWI36_0329p0010 [Hamiltosporidium magnivora]|uniref:Uncharacterized protein n=1 Tax=Hamiltosporidium magnivora TaxID=148818 RepID=A0A4Q9LJ68_9MICR|nr:hypothetical protein CWI36_0329p0010 [Hamiltosporidium magnivora]